MSKTPSSGQAAKTVTRGTKIGQYTAMGTAADGTVIIAPKSRPKTFSVKQIRSAVRAVKSAQRGKLGA